MVVCCVMLPNVTECYLKCSVAAHHTQTDDQQESILNQYEELQKVQRQKEMEGESGYVCQIDILY